MDWRKDHPSHHISTAPDSNLWFGVEVEGVVHRGAYTAFIAAPLPEKSADVVLRLVRRTVVTQVFFTETLVDYEWLTQFVKQLEGISREIKEQRNATLALTVGRVPEQVQAFLEWRKDHPTVGMIARLFDCPWITDLRGCDCITVGVPYTMRSFVPTDGPLTVPEQYENDV